MLILSIFNNFWFIQINQLKFIRFFWLVNFYLDPKFKDLNKDKFKYLQNEYDDILLEFFSIIEQKREKELVGLSENLDEVISELKPADVLELETPYLFKNSDPNPNEDVAEEEKVVEDVYEVTFQTDTMYQTKGLRVLHFNDVYNIEEKQHEPVSGNARFYTAMREMEKGKLASF